MKNNTCVVRETETVYGIENRTKVFSSPDAERILRPYFYEIDEIESFHVLVLSRNNAVIAHKIVSFGGTSGCIADPKVIFKYALSIKAMAGIIVAHNHPSGNLTPSQSDLDLTIKLKNAGLFLEAPLMDHLILTPDHKYVSLKDEGHF